MSFTTTELIAYTVCCASMVVAVALIIAPYLAASPERRQIRSLAGKPPGNDPWATPAPEAIPEADLTRYQDTPLTWPGPVLPPSDEAPTALRPMTTWDRNLLRAAIVQSGATIDGGGRASPSDAALSGLTRHEAADWSGWRDYSRRATGGDDESGEPWRAGE